MTRIRSTPRPSGRELAYAQKTDTASTTSQGAAAMVDVAELIITVTATTRPFSVDFYGSVYNATINNGVLVAIVEAAAGDTNRTPVWASSQMISAGIASAQEPFYLPAYIRDGVTGTRTFKVQFARTVGGTANILPTSWIRALEH